MSTAFLEVSYRPMSAIPTHRSADAFRYPIYFIHRVLVHWPELSNSALPAVEDLARKFNDGRSAWTLQTYMRLKSRGHDVRVAGEYVPGQINFMHYDDLAIKHRPDRAFIVAVEPDRPRPILADVRIVQNHLQLKNSADYFMPHWPQPGLIARDPSRGNEIKRIGYVGLPAYLAAEFQSDDFRKRLAEIGMDLVIRDKDFTNCADLDAILAVRHVSPFDLSIKPASKLVNAWLAGCPALLGEEPAYQNLRKTDLDYFEIRTATDAIAVLKKLKENPALYRQMIANGLQRGEEFSVESICQQWESLFTGPITQAYERWLGQPSIARFIRFGFRSIKQKQERRKFFKLIKN
jgi:hypothetical protein